MCVVSRLIKLTQGYHVLVDAEDYDALTKFNWQACNWKNGIYVAKAGVQTKGIREKNMAMHRYLLNPPDGKFVDHINGNGLDNRKANLRICTNMQNQHNARLSKTNTSGFKGARWHKIEKKYIVGIRVDGKLLHVGYFRNKREAAEAYDKAAIKYFGEFALTNKMMGLL